MTEKPAKPPKSKSAKAAEKPTVARKRTPRRRKPSNDEIAERAYFIHLDEGEHDELANWLRAERELTSA